MAGPFYNNIKGTTAGTPGTGAFTPNAASAGALAWSTVSAGVFLVRYEDGSDWELQYSYWSGTTLSRSATLQFVASSTGSALTLTSAATAALVTDANEVGPDWLGLPARGYIAINGANTTPTAIGQAAPTVTGTAAAAFIGNTSFFTQQPRVQLTSATTANAQAGWSSATNWHTSSSTTGVGGYVFGARFGTLTIPTGPRLFVGLSNTTYIASTVEPSAANFRCAGIAKDSTDTNIQFMVANSAAGTKVDTGIALAASGFYEVTLWAEPGSLNVSCLLVRLDTGAVYYGKATSNTPSNGTSLLPMLVAGLNGTNTGTAMVLHPGHMLSRQVS